jgi:hypothetical protein
VCAPAKAFALFPGIARRCSKSLSFPTNMATTLAELNPASVWALKSFSHRVALAYVACLVMSYTSSAPTAPR